MDSILDVMKYSHLRRKIIILLISRDEGVGLILSLSKVCKKFRDYLKDEVLYQLLCSKMFYGIRMKEELRGYREIFKALWGIYIFENSLLKAYIVHHKYGVHPDLRKYFLQRTVDVNGVESPFIGFKNEGLNLIEYGNDDYSMLDLPDEEFYKLGDYPFFFLRAIFLDGYRCSSMHVNSSIESEIKEHMNIHPNSTFEMTIDGLKFIFDEQSSIYNSTFDMKRKYTNFYTDMEDGIKIPFRMIRIVPMHTPFYSL